MIHNPPSDPRRLVLTLSAKDVTEFCSALRSMWPLSSVSVEVLNFLRTPEIYAETNPDAIISIHLSLDEILIIAGLSLAAEHYVRDRIVAQAQELLSFHRKAGSGGKSNN